MRCNAFQNTIMSFLDGKLSGDLADLFEQHLKACPICRKVYMEEVEMSASFDMDVRGLAGPDMAHRVMEALEEASEEEGAFAPEKMEWRFRPAALLVPALGAAVALVLVVTGLAGEEAETGVEALWAPVQRFFQGFLASLTDFVNLFYESGSAACAETGVMVTTTTAPYLALIGIITGLAFAACAGLVWKFKAGIAREVMRI